MTFVAGVSSGKSCIITAENMVTFNKSVKNIGLTSSEQMLPFNMNDTAFKLCNPLAGCIVGIVGNPDMGRKIIREMKSHRELNTLESYEDFLRGFQSIGDGQVALIVGFYDENARVNRLFKWQSANPQHLEVGAFLSAGSGEAYLQMQPDIVQKMFFNDIPITHKVAALSFYFNEKLFHRLGGQLSKAGVGGCFFSLGLEEDQVIPQGDTAICKFDLVPSKNAIYLYVTKLAFRHGMLFVHSTITGENKVLVNTDCCPEEVAKAIQQHGIKALELLPIDLDDLGHLTSVEYIEMHFRPGNVPSYCTNCKLGEYFSVSETGKNITTDKFVREAIDLVYRSYGLDPQDAKIRLTYR